MRNMTIPQVQKMVGTPFVYFYSDGTSIDGVVAAFVPGKGLTCLATSDVGHQGGSKVLLKDKNGEICLIGIHAEHHNLMKEASIRMREIRDTGEYHVKTTNYGIASCALS